MDISQDHTQSLPNFLCMLPMAVARSSGVVTIRYVLRFRGWHVCFL